MIHEIEERLPLKPYKAEWEAVGSGEDPSLYKPFTKTEVIIPWTFALLYAILSGLSLLGVSG